MTLLTSLMRNSPGLMKSKAGASQAKRVPSTHDAFGKYFAQKIPTDQMINKRKTVETTICTGLNKYI